MRRRSQSARLAALVVILLAQPVAAQRGENAQPLEIARLQSAVTLDGVPNEGAWRAVEPLPMTMYLPVFRGTPTQRTEIRVAYDDENFYVAGRFYDTDPSGIRINSLYRDRWNGDDALAIYIDAFNDNRTAKWFGITAAGMRFDLLLSDDGNVSNASWDTFWAAKTTVTDSGWFAEVRIPFSSLGFHVAPDGRAIMGLTLTRLVSRLEERVTFPAIDPKAEFRRPSLARDVVLRDVRSHKPMYVTPYVLSSAARSTIPAVAGGFADINDRSREAGLDVRYPVSGQLTLDFTANTDFAQVEADDQQVNLDRFPLFFPDRRRFFQEGSEIFDFPMGGEVRLFHSRRIGLTSDFQPVPVLGGVRLVGRQSGWDVGFLEMQTREQGLTPSENFGVLRLRHQVLNSYSNAGVMVTSYAGGGRNNVALATDGLLRLRGDDYLTVRLASTIDDADSAVSLIGRSHAYATLQRRVQRGLAYTVNVTRSGQDFRPELAFLPRRNYTSVNMLANRYTFTDKHPILRRVYPGMLAFSTYRNTDHALESGQYAVWVQWDTKKGGGGWIEPKLFHENVLTPFTIGNRIAIPRGSYDFADLQFALSMGAGARLRSAMDFRSGTYFDGRRTQIILTPTWNASKHLELGADYQLSALRFPVRDQSVNLHVARVRIRSALNAKAFGNAFVQFNSTTRRVDANVRLRYAPAEGTDLWIVYNEGLDTDRSTDPVGGGVRSPFSLARSLIVKYSHTLAF
jgi:hypothetical protein